jgi:hypothetical protein
MGGVIISRFALDALPIGWRAFIRCIRPCS